jgi:hypothetical protein
VGYPNFRRYLGKKIINVLLFVGPARVRYHNFRRFASGPGSFRAITFAWELELGNLRLGTFARGLSFEDLSFRNIRLEL